MACSLSNKIYKAIRNVLLQRFKGPENDNVLLSLSRPLHFTSFSLLYFVFLCFFYGNFVNFSSFNIKHILFVCLLLTYSQNHCQLLVVIIILLSFSRTFYGLLPAVIIPSIVAFVIL